MGEYQKTFNKIKELTQKLNDKRATLETIAQDISDLEEEINDLNGYLLELDAIDNTDPNAPKGYRLKTTIYLYNRGCVSVEFTTTDEEHAQAIAQAWNEKLKEAHEYPNKFYYVGYDEQ